jgi:hypothetical protein
MVANPTPMAPMIWNHVTFQIQIAPTDGIRLPFF